MYSSSGDFWWLHDGQSRACLLVGLGRQKGLPAEDDVPPIIRCRSSLGQGSTCGFLHPLGAVDAWRAACENTNTYRTLSLYDSKTRKASTLGPFVVDIDNQSGDLDNENSDLEDAKRVALQVVDLLVNEWKLTAGDIVVLFTGHKGFNVEVSPAALRIAGSSEEQVQQSREKQDSIIDSLQRVNSVRSGTSNEVSSKGTVIDRIYGSRHDGRQLRYPWVRLHSSINAWIDRDGKCMARAKIRLEIDELQQMSADDIAATAERIAQSPCAGQ